MAGTNEGRSVVNIDALLPPDIVFVVAGQDYRLRGNIEAAHAFKIMRLQEQQDAARESSDLTEFMLSAQTLHDYLLDLFREKQPKIEELPWDMSQMNRIASVILARAMGATPEALSEMGDDEDPPKARAAGQRKPRSTPPTGSARS
jgi:hypothetical protein